jgi:hypothetical protein
MCKSHCLFTEHEAKTLMYFCLLKKICCIQKQLCEETCPFCENLNCKRLQKMIIDWEGEKPRDDKHVMVFNYVFEHLM